MARVLTAIAGGAVLKAHRRGLFSYVWLELPGGGDRECLRSNTVEAALKRRLLIAIPGRSPGHWEFRLSSKAKRIVQVFAADSR